MKKLVIKTTKSELYKDYLSIMQPVLNITNKELDILAELCAVQSDITDKKYLPLVLSTETRKSIREKLGVSEAAFNNNISKLKRRNYISDVTGVSEHIMFVDADYKMVFEFKLV